MSCRVAQQQAIALAPSRTRPGVAGKLQATACSATSRVSETGYLLWCQSSGSGPHVLHVCSLQASARPSESSNKAEAGRTVVLVKSRPPVGGGGSSGKGSAGKVGKGPASEGPAGEAEATEGAPRKVNTLWADLFWAAMQDCLNHLEGPNQWESKAGSAPGWLLAARQVPSLLQLLLLSHMTATLRWLSAPLLGPAWQPSRL